MYYPAAARQIGNLQSVITDQLDLNDFKERLIFPNIYDLSIFQNTYDDIKLEYLVDTINSDEKEYIFAPEFRTIIEHYANNDFADVQDYRFMYIQNTFAYTSVERKYIKENLIIGGAIINPRVKMDQWLSLTKAARECVKESCGGTISYKGSGCSDLVLDNNLVGYCKMNDSSMSFHLSLTDIYNTTRD